VCGLFESATSFFQAYIPIDMLKPTMNIGIVVSDHLEVAAEKSVICYVKSDDRGISKTDVSGVFV
jgi:hypothetical protein